MQTLIFLLLTFLLVIFSILLYFKTKHQRVKKLDSGECPNCGEKTRTFFDEQTKTMFKNEAITKRVLKNHGCSGVVEFEYRCKHCGLKEVHPQSH
ncbi:hypothetical protein CP960_08945 [Malaciobacter halophilus]|uniref:Uncharacterized protein n=1 Tax=Malaciobacter halophilus TaxID=197482 RepID=A0A2N1J1U9_9BACT|nr:hypothetical protein [Malaciobacter halophilus]AXH10845.1 hypothetical protein AHALO_2518 [Malaciobacter halophilus]PKI80528.1 hypothetical protein CP960_08945 [Malaciobacter halophilus]